MTGRIAAPVADYIELRRGLGYRSPSQERALRVFARYLDRYRHDGPIADLLHAAAGLAPAGGLRPRCYVTLFGLLACTGLRICEAPALTCADVDLTGGVLTVRAGKCGRTRLS